MDRLTRDPNDRIRNLWYLGVFPELDKAKELWLLRVKLEDTDKVLNTFLQLLEK